VRPTLGYRDGHIGDEDGGWLGAADGTEAPTPAGSQGRNKARRREQTVVTVSSPPCGVPGVLLVGGEAAEREIDSGGRALGFMARAAQESLGARVSRGKGRRGVRRRLI
jgi:hypothetical protein